MRGLIGQSLHRDVEVTVNLGRNKRQVFVGELSGVYPALFTVKPHDKAYLGKTAFSYSEILCGAVRLKGVFAEAKGED